MVSMPISSQAFQSGGGFARHAQSLPRSLNSPPSHRPHTIASLPVELLTRIALLLGRTDALNLALVSRAFTFSADNRIWRDLDLFLHPQFGELPLIQPYERYDGRHPAWAKMESRKAEDRRRVGLKDKVKRIMMEGSVKRFGMVERVKVVPRPEALHAIIGLLEMVSPNLRELDIVAPAHHLFANDWKPSNSDTLDVKVLDYHLHFPALVNLRVHLNSVRFPEFVTLLCSASPNLISLDVDVQHALETPKWDDSMYAKYPGRYGVLTSTKLRKLRLLFRERVDANVVVANPVVRLIYDSPHLEQASLDLAVMPANPMISHILRSLASKKHLRDLHISLHPELFCQHTDKMLSNQFPSLRRLVLLFRKDLDFFLHLPHFAKLEQVFIQRTDRRVAQQTTSGFPEYTASAAVFPEFATRLWRSPRLRSISNFTPNEASDVFDQLDDVERAGQLTGLIRSVRHRGEELLHARLLLHHIKHSDALASSTADIPFNAIRIPYLTRIGVKRETTFTPRPHYEGVWADYIEYDGYAIPIDIMTKMRYADGAGAGNWDARGVRVSDVSWKVLTDWRDRQSGSGTKAQPREGRKDPEPTSE